MSGGSGKEMAVSGGGNGGGKGVVSGAIKIAKFMVTIFALFVAVKLIGPMMDSATALAGAFSQALTALTDLVDQISAALSSIGGGQ